MYHQKIFSNHLLKAVKMTEKLVEINNHNFIIELMYADTKQNMTGKPVYKEIGFGNKALVHKDLWNKLEQLIPWLEEHKRKLKIFDAYRPPLAHEKLREVIPQPGFFAINPATSPHCRATAVDVCLTDENGNELTYPTLVDAYDPDYATEVQQGKSEAFFEYLKKARHDYEDASKEALHNRRELKSLMESIGLKALPHEWWHYELPNGREDDKYPMIK